MYKILTRREIQLFPNKSIARRFYREAAEYCEGAEADHYFSILDAIASGTDYEATVWDWSDNPRDARWYQYDSDKNCLVIIGGDK